MVIDFDGPYDKAMKQVEDLAYYANYDDDELKRLLPREKRGKGTNEAVPKPVKPEDLGKEKQYETD